MARRAKSPKGKAKNAKRPLALKPPKDEGTRVRDLERRLAEALEQVQTRHDELAEALKGAAGALQREAEALEQQTATAEILRVISSSPTDAQPVFDVIARNAVGLCGGYFSLVGVSDGERVHLRATHNLPDEWAKVARTVYPLPLSSGPGTAQVIREQRVVHILDSQEDPAVSALGRERARLAGYHTWLGVPMLGPSGGIGVIAVARREKVAFTDKQIALLQTFADQAVIAIENVRLFKELEARNKDLTVALEQQTATSEILRVISSSQTDVQPVFDTIVRSAVRLCDGLYSALHPFDGELIHLVAQHNFTPEALEAAHRIFPTRPTRALLPGRAILERAVVHIPDVEIDPEPQSDQGLTRRVGWRSGLFVPMLREGVPIGVIVVARAEPGPFSDNEIKLVQTFADQAVIAIENVRLFTELQASNRDLTTALDKQTATSDILRVISRSQTDVQPVFDAIMASAVQLLRADTGVLTRVTDNQIELAAVRGSPAADAALKAVFPRPLQAGGVHAQAIRERAPVSIADVPHDSRLDEAIVRAYAQASGAGSAIVVPLLRHDEAIGAIGMNRREAGGFTDDEIALLQTFADQAVIAIENARLLSELQVRTAELTQSVGELRALGEVGQAISSTLDLQTVLSTIVARATQLSGTEAGVIYEYDEGREVFLPRATEHLEAEIVETMLATPVRKGEGATGQLAEIQEPVQVPDILSGPAESRVRSALVRAGYRALLAVPLVRDDHLLGGLTVIRKSTGAFAPGTIELLQTFATQSSLAIQNARLFREIESKSRELEVASQHKSEFLANMSHELRTPLNAIIGYSELLEEDAADLDGGRLVPDLQKIASAAKHQLSLINDILDLSKVEAGRMELDLSEFDLPHAIENALILVRERASRRGIALGRTIDKHLGTLRGDERKVKQVLLNLLSNALKFTPEGGRIDITAALHDGKAEIAVSDTGVGIAPEDREAIFEEFRQVGSTDKKIEGTGLGLALARKFVELHGGRIWVESRVGAGSTFTFTLPKTGSPAHA
jgi:signal transduction histidine kinase/putative methionine-R-sulfoxide reductase with GAF domain